MATFVLVHGAWHGSWCWRHVAPRLRQRGHAVHTPDLPGHGADPAPPERQTLDSYAQRVADVLRSLPGPVILVGHSLAGLVISLVAEASPERIQRLVYVTGLLPRDGDSLVRICSVDPDNPMDRASVRTPDGKCVTVDPAHLSAVLCHDCPDDDLAFAREHLGPEPLATLFGTVHVTPERFGRVPRAYIYCTKDVALPLFIQQRMVAASPCETELSLDTSHSPFFAAPEQLAVLLDSLA